MSIAGSGVFQRPPNSARLRGWLLHAARWAMLAAIVALLHRQQLKLDAERRSAGLQKIPVAMLQSLFPSAKRLGAALSAGGREVLDADGQVVGYVMQTVPDAEPSSGSLQRPPVGFSGPTELLLGFNSSDKVVGARVIDSADTPEHVEMLRRSPNFLRTWNGLTRDQIATAKVDAVSGATLTSLAASESVARRFGGQQPSIRFPLPPTVAELQAALELPELSRVDWSTTEDPSAPALFNEQGQRIGRLWRTSPAGDRVLGYQGPTEAWVLLDTDGRIRRWGVGASFDNEPYVGYVRSDAYFRERFAGLTIDELASLNLEQARIEGVSGATMTSLAVAESLVAAAQQRRAWLGSRREMETSTARWWRSLREHGLAWGVIVAGVALALLRFRGRRIAIAAFRWVVILYLGFVQGAMLSQAMLFGWSRHGIPWQTAPTLALLTLAALLLPLTGGANVYCHHLCAHGAAQQLLRRVSPRRSRLAARAGWLSRLPWVVLLACATAAILQLPVSLADLEPFDAWSPQVAGGAALSIALLGLACSAVMPMAYCRYGCPTGKLLAYLRHDGRSHRWSRRDWVVLALLGLAAWRL
ncbi:MAG: FMN-binding protein [Planctomycetales bacterium]|nr:FMN-binding protein [Planctomycetales bacterium]